MQIKTKIVSCHTAESEPAKQEVNGTVILHPLVFPDSTNKLGGMVLIPPLLLGDRKRGGGEGKMGAVKKKYKITEFRNTFN